MTLTDLLPEMVCTLLTLCVSNHEALLWEVIKQRCALIKKEREVVLDAGGD